MGTFNAGLLGRSGVNVPNATVDAVGGDGKGLATAGASLVEIGEGLAVQREQINNRTDTISRVRANEAYKTIISTESARRETETDMSDPKGALDFDAFIRGEAAKILGEHTGSAASKAVLTAELERQSGASRREFSTATIKAGRAVVNTALDTQLSAISAKAAATGQIQAAFDEGDLAVDSKIGALSSAEEADRKKSHRHTTVKTTFDRFMDDGDTASAKALFNIKGLIDFMPPDQLIDMRGQILKVEREAEKGAEKGRQKVAELEAIIGTTLTTDQRLKAAGLAETDGSQTLQDKVTEFTKVTGVAPTNDQMAKMAGAFIAPDGEDNLFGTSVRGRSKEITVKFAPAFFSGDIDPEDERAFNSAVAELNRTIEWIDPVTGEKRFIQPVLPPHITEAYTRRDKPIPGSVQSASGAAEKTGADDPLSLDAPAPEKTIFDLAGLVTGPVSGALALAGRTPVLGEFIRPEEVEQARSQVGTMVNSLIRVLQTNPRFSEGEREQIKSEIDLGSSVFDTAGAFRSRVIGIDDALAARQQDAQRIVDSEVVGRAEKLQAIKEANAIRIFRINLGAPKIMSSPEEAKKLAPGAPFRVKGTTTIFFNTQKEE